MKRVGSVFAFAVLLGAAAAMPTAATAADPAPAKALAIGTKAEFVRNFDAAGDKLVQLAEAIPADKYSWRPAEGVRSIAEVLLHAAGGNFMMTSFIGAKTPDGIDLKAIESSTTKKEEIIARVKQSLEHVRSAANAVADSDMDTLAKWFVGERPKREVLFLLAAHNHEHLGQLIAYARMNGVTPPWSKKD